MRPTYTRLLVVLVVALRMQALWSLPARADVRAWEGELTIPTYPWKDDINPKFWAIEGSAKLSTTIHGAITYQEQIFRTRWTVRVTLHPGRAYLDEQISLYNPRARDHHLLALHAAGRKDAARVMAKQRIAGDPTALIARALLGLQSEAAMAQFAREARAFVGEDEFELLETSLAFADLGLMQEASRILQTACVDEVPPAERSFMPFYYLAWCAAQRDDLESTRRWLKQAATVSKDGVFASRPEEVDILQYAIQENPGDAQAHLQVGCLLANLGRLPEATAAWQKAAERNARLSIAWRNLGLAAAVQNDLARAERCYRKAIGARPGDQTLHRDLAEILVAARTRPEAVQVLESMPLDGVRRGEITVMLADYYVSEERFEDCIKLLESTPYFVNWEGQDVIWRLFNRAHIERGRRRLDARDAQGALADFEASLTYPANLNVGRSNKPPEAAGQYWRGMALVALGNPKEARTAWRAGAAGADSPGQQREYIEKCRQALAKDRQTKP